jgi:hypothetical protein
MTMKLFLHSTQPFIRHDQKLSRVLISLILVALVMGSAFTQKAQPKGG